MTPRKTTTAKAAETPEAVAPHDAPPVDGVEPLEGTPDPDVATTPEPTNPDAPASPDETLEADTEDDPIQAKIQGDADEYDLDDDPRTEPSFRVRGSGPQTIPGYTPPEPAPRGDKPLGFADSDFALTTGPTAPSIVEQQALTAIGDHLPESELPTEPPSIHDAD